MMCYLGVTWNLTYLRVKHWGFMRPRRQHLINVGRDGWTVFLGPLIVCVALARG